MFTIQELSVQPGVLDRCLINEQQRQKIHPLRLKFTLVLLQLYSEQLLSFK